MSLPLRKLVRLGEVQQELRDGDLLLFRSRGLISVAGRGVHSHAAKVAWWGSTPFCLEVREWYGGRAVTLASQVERYPGRIDLFRANPEDRWPEYDAAASTRYMRRLAGCDYGYASVMEAALLHLPVVRNFVTAEVEDNAVSRRPPFCSQACAMADRLAGGVDPAPYLADRLTEPADLPAARSTTTNSPLLGSDSMRRNRWLLASLATTATVFTWHDLALGQCGPNGCPLPPKRHSPYQPASTGVPSAVRASLASLARIVHRDASGTSLGSGVLIDSRGESSHFLTCAHLFEAAGQTSVQLNGQRVSARVVAIDKRHDLALLRTSRVTGAPVSIGEIDPRSVLTACGFGSTGERRCVTGRVTGSATAVGAEAPSLRIRGSVRSGDSGGPVFDTLGRVVAVIWGQRNGETYAMGGGPLRRILSRLRGRSQATESEPKPIPRARPTRPSEAPIGSASGGLARRDDLQRLESQWQQRFDRLSNEVNVNRNEPPVVPAQRFGWLKMVEPTLTALAVGGPLGVGLFAGRAWLRRRANRSANTTPQRNNSSREPVAVDSPPPPQQVVPQTHYVSYERDEFAKAHQWVCEQLARKFPGAVEILASLDSLIKQQLNGGARR